MLETVMKDPFTALDAFAESEAENPEGNRYKRNRLIKWAVWERKWGKRIEQVDGEKAAPMEQNEYLLWATNKKGWAADSAQREWEGWVRSDAERDEKGLGGCLRIWVNKGKSRMNHRHLHRGRIDKAVAAIQEPFSGAVSGAAGAVCQSSPAR